MLQYIQKTDNVYLQICQKDKHIVDEIYYSLEDILKNQAKPILEIKSSLDIIRKRTYLQYIMGQDLRWLIVI